MANGRARGSSIIEGTKESLQRLRLEYVDIIFAHRPDPTGECLRIRLHSAEKRLLISSDRGDG